MHIIILVLHGSQLRHHALDVEFCSLHIGSDTVQPSLEARVVESHSLDTLAVQTVSTIDRAANGRNERRLGHECRLDWRS